MSQHYSIELDLDLTSVDAVSRIWDRFTEAGIPLSKQGSLSPPHVSLAIADDLDRTSVEHVLSDFAKDYAPLKISFSSVGVFVGDASVVFLAPVVSHALLDIHADLHTRLKPLMRQPWPYYLRDVWVPHCTLAQDLSRDELTRAVELASQTALPLSATLESISLVRFHPVTKLVTFTLGLV